MKTRADDCVVADKAVLRRFKLLVASNRGPFKLQPGEDGSLNFERGSGGLVTALLGLMQTVGGSWVACAQSDEDRAWQNGLVDPGNSQTQIQLQFVDPPPEMYNGYYNVISNPLLWFLQHSMWDIVYSPTITRETWDAWENGYVEANRMFAEAIGAQIKASAQPTLVMLQDYHLYLAPRQIRRHLSRRAGAVLSMFVHIPWPGPEDWSMLPPAMRQAILDGLCAVDILGFQTREDGLNFIRTCESLLPKAHVNYRAGRVWLHNHATLVRDFPISIDVEATRQQAESEEAEQYRLLIEDLTGDRQLIVRIDRTEPSKNIVRGFQAFDELLSLYPEYHGKVIFLAILVPSRLEVQEYKSYLDELMAAAGRVNARHGSSDWEPVRVLVGESYPRALAALRLYDVLLVNPIADGMNLVAKEGPVVNQKDGVVILSERAGAVQQLGGDALVISPCDIYATAEAMHAALTMPADERARRAQNLRQAVEREDIHTWLCWQLDEIGRLRQVERND